MSPTTARFDIPGYVETRTVSFVHDFRFEESPCAQRHIFFHLTKASANPRYRRYHHDDDDDVEQNESSSLLLAISLCMDYTDRRGICVPAVAFNL